MCKNCPEPYKNEDHSDDDYIPAPTEHEMVLERLTESIASQNKLLKQITKAMKRRGIW